MARMLRVPYLQEWVLHSRGPGSGVTRQQLCAGCRRAGRCSHASTSGRENGVFPAQV